ncbi:MAG TPA: metallophosphoesterase, partial [Opitutales bacterium]|nr:metallophosphoesterase [Opitutales bacterium]
MKLKLLLPLIACGFLGSARGAEATYSVAVMPDIQYYYNNYQSGNYAKLISQIRWIGLTTESENIRLVAQLGDITQNDNNDVQWAGAKGAFDILNGIVPYVLTVGNHDGVDNGRDSWFDLPKYFGRGSNYTNQSTFGGCMTDDDTANSYHFIDTGERTWMVVTLEWAPRDAVLVWLDSLLAAHSEYRTIILVHAYLYMDNARMDSALYDGVADDGSPKTYPAVAGDPEGCNDAQDIWRKVIKQHPQVALVYSGHVGHVGIGRRFSIGERRQVVQERLTDFQGWLGNGNGWMQTLKFSADGDLAETSSFSPFLGTENTDPDLHYFTPYFDDVLPAGRQQAEAELAPSYSFDLCGWSALRPIRNRSDGKDGHCLISSRRSGYCHVFGYGDTVAGSIPVRSGEWSFATWVRFDPSFIAGGT